VPGSLRPGLSANARERYEQMLSQRWAISPSITACGNVILNEEIIRSDIGDKLNRLLCPVQEKARNVAGVDRLNQKPNTLACEGIRSES